MKATVSEDCIGCGLCEGTCPEVFAIGDDGLAHAIATAALLPPLSSTSPSRIHVQLQCKAYRTAIQLIISYHVRVASAALIYYVYAQNIKGTP